MALVMLAILPLLVATGATMARFITKYIRLSQQQYAEAGSIAEQAFQSIRTVYAFSLQSRFTDRYKNKLAEACRVGEKRGITMVCVIYIAGREVLWSLIQIQLL